MKKIVVVLLVLVCGLATMSYANGFPSPKISHRCASQYKKQAAALAQNHQWISFKCRNIHYWNGEEGWNAVISVIKNSFKLPLAEIVIDRLPRSEFTRKKSPLAACLVDVKDSVHNVTERMFSGSFLRVNDFFITCH